MRYFDNAVDFMGIEDAEMACSEMRKASLVMKMHFTDLQQYAPKVDWFEERKENRRFLAVVCTPNGY